VRWLPYTSTTFGRGLAPSVLVRYIILGSATSQQTLLTPHEVECRSHRCPQPSLRAAAHHLIRLHDLRVVPSGLNEINLASLRAEREA
jgi:hypothetical protein